MHKLCDGISVNLISDNLTNNNVVLVVNNERFPCDKVCLQNASPYFQAMFNSSMKESTAGEIDIRDVEPDVFKILLDYAHSNHLPILTSNENDFNSVCDLLKAACIFQFDDVSKQCCKYLSNIMDDSNCLKMWELADVLELPDLRVKAKRHALWNGEIMLENDEILEASFETFFEIVSRDTLHIKSELTLLRAIIRWIKENEPEREKCVMLLKEVRLGDLTRADFKTVPEDLAEFLDLSQCGTNNGQSRKSFEILHEPNKKSRSVPYKPLLYGYSFHGRKNKLNIHFHVQQDMHFKEISSICVYFKTLTGFGVCVVGKDVYMFGGREKVHFGKWNQQMWKYDSLKEKWIIMSQIPFCRRGFQCLVVGNCIYVLGGYGEFRAAQTSMLCYDIDTGEWSEKCSPPQCMYSFVAVSGHHLGLPVIFFFATGLHIYQPLENTWLEVSETPVVSGILNAVEYGGHLYLMTQEPDSNVTLIYLYKPGIPPIPIANSLSEDCSNFTVLDDKIYIFTDNGVEVITVSSVENYGCQVMFKWRNEQRKPLNAHLKFVGLVPFYEK